jgi:hypothetical protein
MAQGYEVNIVNPRPRRRRAAPRKRRAAPRRKGRQRNPGMMEMQANGGWRPARAPSRRRQRNPTLGGLSFGWSDALQSAVGRLLGKAAAAWAVRSFGNTEENQISGGASPTTGLRWSFLNHVICLATGAAAAAIIGKKAPRLAARMFEGAVDLSVTKAFWSEIVHRTTAGPKYLGATEGQVYEDGRGGTFVRQGGQWVPMMGRGMGALEQEVSMDGLEYANSLGRRPSNYTRRRALSGVRPAMTTDGSVYSNGKSDNPYLRAFQS